MLLTTHPVNYLTNAYSYTISCAPSPIANVYYFFIKFIIHIYYIFLGPADPIAGQGLVMYFSMRGASGLPE